MNKEKVKSILEAFSMQPVTITVTDSNMRTKLDPSQDIEKIELKIKIEKIFAEEMKGDTSFQERETWLSLLLGATKYSKHKMRETWDRGIKLGIEIGLNRASLEGQRIELNHNTPEGKNKKFLEKFYKLAEEYKCAIQYHPQIGMVVLNREY